MVLALADDSCMPGTAAVAVALSLAPRTMAWLFTDTGQIVNALDPLAVLTPQAGNPPPLVVCPRRPGNPPVQSWKLTEEGLIYNLGCMQVLTVSIADGATTLSMLSVVEGGAAIGLHQRWQAAPCAAR